MTLTVKEILEKIRTLPEEFTQAYEAGKWCAAAMAYENALLMTRFIRMEEGERAELIGRFDQDKVRYAFVAAGW